MSNSNKLSYRPEIDGLRAIAVFAVIIFHAQIEYSGKPILPGGFIGVDIFFVISGYLITSIILNDIQNKNFSFLHFYERRIRRLLPVLIVVQLMTIPLAYIYLFPIQLMEYTGSLASSVLFISNYFFWMHDNYDAERIELKPLIHTWSLAVEEQFYIIFPPLLITINKYIKKYMLPILILLFVVSLLAADYFSGLMGSKSSSFYLIYARGWELTSGAILAKLSQQYDRGNNVYLNTIAPIIGLILVSYSFVLFNAYSLHPSLLTLIPVSGAMLIIWFSGTGDLVTRLLSSRVAVYLGLISYSLYLFHQPLLAFSRISINRDLSQLESICIIILTIFVASVSYAYVEKPTRNKNKTKMSSLLLVVITFSISFLIFGYYSYLTNGLPTRYPVFFNNIIQLGTNRTSIGFTPNKNILRNDTKELAGGLKLRIYKSKVPSKYSIITVGDSHTGTLNKPVLTKANKFNYFISATQGGCFFQLNLDMISSKRRWCSAKYNQDVLREILRHENQIVILGGRLPFYKNNVTIKSQKKSIKPDFKSGFADPKNKWPNLATPLKVRQSIVSTVDTLLKNNIKVVLIYPIPEVGIDTSRMLLNILHGKTANEIKNFLSKEGYSFSYKLFKEQSNEAYRILNHIEDDENLIRIYPENLFCKNKVKCMSRSNSGLYFLDDDHLSYIGASMLLDEILLKIKAKWEISFIDDT